MRKKGPAQLPRAERFAERTKDGLPPSHAPELGPCLVWTGTRLKKRGGYGTFYDDDCKLKRAHRVAWEIATGVSLSPDEHVLHRCDNPPCVRFSHLKLGDQRSNMEDMCAKGRRRTAPPRGEDQYLALLTDEMVLTARRRFAAGEEIQDVVCGSPSPTALRAAVYGQSWLHLEMPDYSGRNRKPGERATHCPQGHEYAPENTGQTTDKQGYQCRYCKQCNRERAYARFLKRCAAEGRTPATSNPKKTHCPAGHAYSPENTRVRPDGYRICRTCHRDAERARAARG